MARGNQRELARKKAAKKAGDHKQAHSILKEKDKLIMTITCKVCRQTFMCTSTKAILQSHVDARHAKNDFQDCFDDNHPATTNKTD